MSERVELLRKLEAVEVDFDPTASTDLEKVRPTKTAFVPLQLYKDILAFIRKTT